MDEKSKPDISTASYRRRLHDGDIMRLLAAARATVGKDNPNAIQLYEAVISALTADKLELERELVTDPLTGLFNRNTLQEKLAAAQREAELAGTPYSVVFLDIDDFKNVNGQYGHIAGDFVLHDSAVALKDIVREDDTLTYRYGGEEFLLVAPRTSEAQAARLVERVVTTFNERHIGEAYMGGNHVTISAGAASWYEGMTPDKVVKCANYGLVQKAKKIPGKGMWYVVKCGELVI